MLFQACMHPAAQLAQKENCLLFCAWCIVLEKTMPPKKVMKSMKVKKGGLEKPRSKKSAGKHKPKPKSKLSKG